MKRLPGFIIVLAFTIPGGCAREGAPLRPQVDLPVQESGSAAQHGLGTGVVIRVPGDFATIQQAVDASTDGQRMGRNPHTGEMITIPAKIIVRSGEYTEVVEVPVPGLRILALGRVTLNGAFHVTGNGVTIDGFAVNRQGVPSAIAVEGAAGHLVSGVTISHNVVVANDGGGIDFDWATECTIPGNECSGTTLLAMGTGLAGAIDLDHVSYSKKPRRLHGTTSSS